MAEDMFPQINKNRVITMRPTNGDDHDIGWRGNLYRLLNRRELTGNNSARVRHSMFDRRDIWNVSNKVELLMNENKALKSTSTPEQPLKQLANKAQSKNGMISKISGLVTVGASIINAVANSGEGQTSGVFDPWIANINAWSGGRVISMNYTFDFAMGQYGLWNAREEVVKPILNLLAPTLPQYMDPAFIYGSYPNGWGLLVNFLKDIFSDNDFFETTKNENGELVTNRKSNGSILEGSWLQQLAEKLEAKVLQEYKYYTYDITFGNLFTFNKMLPTASTVKLSNEVDQYGYPIAGSIEMTFDGIMPPALNTYTEEELAVVFGDGGHLHGKERQNNARFNRNYVFDTSTMM